MNKNYWEQRWQQNQTGWDLQQVSPPLAAYIDHIKPTYAHQPVLVPGCGSGYEALYLLDAGFSNITMLDISAAAISKMENMLNTHVSDWRQRLHLACGDFFTHIGSYHLILEQTFFCALDPKLRLAYAQKMHELLAPSGVLAGVLFNRDFEGGPPFGGNTAEYSQLFKELFTIEILEPCRNSVAPRLGSEVFIQMRKKV
jgi:SAM-dependent methyltransferase